MRSVDTLVSGRSSGLFGCCVSALLLLGCDVFDPVYTHHLCQRPGIISANCDGCRKPPFLPNCSQCQGDSPADGCGQGETAIDSGAAGEEQPGGAAGTSAPGTGGVSAPPAGGVGASGRAGSAGNVAPPGGGTGGAKPPEPFRCAGDMDCSGSTPACLIVQQRCVECVENKHCKLGACDPNAHRCVECVASTDCKAPQVCDTTLQRCVECRKNPDCTDPVLDVCSSALKCVDCDGDNSGCASDPAHPACVAQQCVECDADADCGRKPNLHKCLRSSHTCVECLTQNTDCQTQERPVCKMETQSCVGCLAGSDCASHHCVGEKCVQCEADSDCPSSTAAHCAGNACVPCTASSQCAHLGATPACDTSKGVCVPCVDDSTCGATSCIRSMHKCGTTTRGSVKRCGTCAADTECGSNMKCVALPGETVCLYNGAAGCATASAPALRPFTRSVSGSSIDAARGPFCAPPTTCAAFTSATTPAGGADCPNGATDCGLGRDDGICNRFTRCTYACSAPIDCPSDGALSACPDSRQCSQPASP
jgi:hypothetical protein